MKRSEQLLTKWTRSEDLVATFARTWVFSRISPHSGERGYPEINAGALRRNRRGLALLVVIAALGIASAMGMSLVKLTLAHRRQADRELFAIQARWLAESGVDRAAVLLMQDEKAGGQSWSVTAEELGGRHAADVSITIKPIENSPQRREVVVVAEFPTGTNQRARETVARIVDISRFSKESNKQGR